MYVYVTTTDFVLLYDLLKELVFMKLSIHLYQVMYICLFNFVGSLSDVSTVHVSMHA